MVMHLPSNQASAKSTFIKIILQIYKHDEWNKYSITLNQIKKIIHKLNKYLSNKRLDLHYLFNCNGLVFSLLSRRKIRTIRKFYRTTMFNES